MTTTDSTQNHYEVLGVKEHASAEDIRSAYKKLALEYHPEKKGEDSTEIFQKIQNAYEILSDKQKRSNYDTKTKARKARKDSKSAKSSKPSEAKPENEKPKRPTGPGWKDPNFVPKQGTNWRYYNDFSKAQWRGPMGGTQNFHHFDWSERARWADWYGAKLKPWETPFIRKAERRPFTGNDRKVEDFKRQYHSYIESLKQQHIDTMESQGSAYRQFTLDAHLRFQKAQSEWSELFDQLEADITFGTATFEQGRWVSRMTELVETQKARESKAFAALIAHTHASPAGERAQREANADTQREVNVIRISARGVISVNSAKLHFDDYCDEQELKITEIKSAASAEQEALTAGKIRTLREKKRKLDALLEEKVGEFERKVFGVPVRGRAGSL